MLLVALFNVKMKWNAIRFGNIWVTQQWDKRQFH